MIKNKCVKSVNHDINLTKRGYYNIVLVESRSKCGCGAGAKLDYIVLYWTLRLYFWRYDKLMHAMTTFLMSCLMTHFLPLLLYYNELYHIFKSWQTFWRHDVFLTNFLTSWQTFSHYDKLFAVLKLFLTSWQFFLTSWQKKNFWHRDKLFDIMTFFLRIK